MTTTVTPQALTQQANQLLSLLSQRPEVGRLHQAQEKPERIVVEGVIRPARGPLWSALRNFHDKPEAGPSLWVTPTSDGAEVLVEDLRALGLDSQVLYFPFREERTKTEDARPVDPMQRAALERLQKAKPNESLLVICPVRALLQKTMSRESLAQNGWTMRQGETTDRDTLLEMMLSLIHI